MTSRTTATWCRRPRPAAEEGQIGLLILGYLVIILLLVLGGIGVTAAQIARVQMYDAADAAALAAADSLDTGAYVGGVGEELPVSSVLVRQQAAQSLAAQGKPSRVTSWELLPGTGSPDGRSAVVQLRGTVKLPVVGAVLDLVGGQVTVTVTSHAEAHVTDD